MSQEHIWEEAGTPAGNGFLLYRCSRCKGKYFVRPGYEWQIEQTACTVPGDEASKKGPKRMPSLMQQAWNLAHSLSEFVADGLKTVTEEQYRQRLEICDGCDRRVKNRCLECGCYLTMKARGRAFKCPKGKWPEV